MADPANQVLPYRIDVADLRRFVNARARGRSDAEIRAMGYAPKTFEGTLKSVACLGLLQDKGGALTSLGRRFALAGDEDLADKLSGVLRSYPPYAGLLDTVLEGTGPRPTPLHWIETWWATRGFGSSESNRSEAAPVFARLVESAELGTFVPGRRGHASRIEWLPAAQVRWTGDLRGPAGEPGVRGGRDALAGRPPQPRAARITADSGGVEAGAPIGADPEENSHITWEFGPGRRVELRVPGRLSRSEREWLLQLFQLLLAD
jgi:hypothetical protein